MCPRELEKTVSAHSALPKTNLVVGGYTCSMFYPVRNFLLKLHYKWLHCSCLREIFTTKPTAVSCPAVLICPLPTVSHVFLCPHLLPVFRISNFLQLLIIFSRKN